MNWPLPKAFDATDETNKIVAKAKQSLTKKFSWKKRDVLYSAVDLVVALIALERYDEAMEICQFLGQFQFDGSFNLWCAIEMSLVLQARLHRQRGEQAAAEECLNRVQEAGFVEDRLEGSMLDRNDAVKESVREGDTKWELPARQGLAMEQAFIIELGGSDKCPVATMETEWDENLARVRELLKPKRK
jgi:hypothetical protein